VTGSGFKHKTPPGRAPFPTPYYNKAIGDVLYSQHQWGSAADIFIDPHDKNRMEDLDGNRIVDIGDSKFLYDRIEDMLAAKMFQRFQGGMGYYPATAAHPPFVHVDVRGTKARWQGELMAAMRAAILVLLAILCAPREAASYSVLAHEANIDALWNTSLRPLLARRFPRATPDEVTRARAYAYGGAVIQDLGYYPFGSHFFRHLVHYTRTGDFVEALIRESHDVNEYAFALGALAHYTADNVGHPDGVNRAVAMMYPKLRAEHGDSVTYADSPATHVIVEFSFDVVQAAGGGYVSDMYQSFVGFQVAKPVLERAFLATYGLEVKDVFMSEDLAIGSY